MYSSFPFINRNSCFSATNALYHEIASKFMLENGETVRYMDRQLVPIRFYNDTGEQNTRQFPGRNRIPPQRRRRRHRRQQRRPQQNQNGRVREFLPVSVCRRRGRPIRGYFRTLWPHRIFWGLPPARASGRRWRFCWEPHPSNHTADRHTGGCCQSGAQKHHRSQSSGVHTHAPGFPVPQKGW